MAERKTVLQPFRSLRDLPDGLDVHHWNADGDPDPATLKDVTFYVMPYMFAPITGEVMARMPSLRVVQTLTAGYEHVLPYLPDGVTLCNARGVHDASTAEIAMALTLASLRRIPEFVRAQEREEWAFGDYESLADRTVLIVGYGSVGAALDKRLVPFECDVLRVARTAREGVAGFEELDALLPRADVVILTVPLNDETRKLMNASRLALMRDGALLVNVARGGVVDTDALVAELNSERLRAAVDVTDPEPLPQGHPLWSVPGLLISPHVGGATTAFKPRALRLVRDQLARYAAGDPLTNIVLE
ncbi:MAG TPA: 2-hydroxyacid dehydrogenase [Jiangellaceae bacterium]